ncbi:MAG: SDR family oxidoreductase [bacterium]|nr:oxidoreductase [Deltaproteobacteria bacterium]MCP4904012.1 SDR family oxidoreductase [bacterium]
MSGAGRLAGKVAFITGAGSGIGRASARLFAQEGASIVIAEVAPELGAVVAEEITKEGGRALFVRTDVTEEESVEAAWQEALSSFDGVHVLFNCAGGSIPEDGLASEIDLAVWEHSLNLDLKGTFLCCRVGIPHIIESGGGSVVNASSVVALQGQPLHAYSAAKGGILSLTRALASSYGREGVRVNAICPGIVLSERIRKRLSGGQLGRAAEDGSLAEAHPFAVGVPEDIAQIALFLASDESRMIHGATIPAEGGLSAY